MARNARGDSIGAVVAVLALAVAGCEPPKPKQISATTPPRADPKTDRRNDA